MATDDDVSNFEFGSDCSSNEEPIYRKKSVPQCLGEICAFFEKCLFSTKSD